MNHRIRAQVLCCLFLCFCLSVLSCSSSVSQQDPKESVPSHTSQEKPIDTSPESTPKSPSFQPPPFLSNIASSVAPMKELLQTSFQEPMYGFIVEENILTGISSTHLYHFDLSSGTLVQSIELPYRGSSDNCFLPNHNKILYTKYNSPDDRDIHFEVIAIHDQKGTLEYTIPNSGCEEYSFSNSSIYSQMSPDHRLTCFDIQTGKKKWEATYGYLTSQALRSPTLEIDGRCYTIYWGPSDHFYVPVQNPSTGEQLQTIDLGEIQLDITYPIKSLYTYDQYLLAYGHIQENPLQMFHVDPNSITPVWHRGDIPILYSQTSSVRVDSTGLYVLSEERKPGEDVLSEKNDFVLYKLNPANGKTIDSQPLFREGYIPRKIIDQGFYPWNGKPVQDHETKNLLIKFWSVDFQTALWCAYDRNTLEKQWEWAVDARYSQAFCAENCWILSKEKEDSTEAYYYFIHPDDGSVLAKWETTVAEDPNFKIHDDTAHFFQDSDKNIWMLETESGELHKLRLP